MREGKRSLGSTDAWRPDARVSLGLAVAAAMLVSLGFAGLFASTVSIRFLPAVAAIRERLVFSAVSPPLPPRGPRRPTPALARPAPIPLRDQAWPPLQPPISLPGAFTAQDYLQERAVQGAAALRDKVMGNQLRRDLGKTKEMPALRDNQSIPTAGGDKMVRSGDSCAQVHTVQGSPSPTNKIDVAEPMPTCPGGSSDAGAQMTKALQDWAKKQLPPPPSR